MKLAPRYDGPAVIRFAGSLDDVSVPLLRQRRRLGELLGGLDDEQWGTASRCDGWTVRDVIAHLVGTDQFWVVSVAKGISGEPTRYLQGFDPVATPAGMVAAMPDAPEEVLARYLAGVDALAEVIGGLDDGQWDLPAEAPPGHVPIRAVGHHALWDGWIHERDVTLPLGLPPTREPDEVLAALRYAAALGPGFLALEGSTRTGTLVCEGTDPDARVVVEAGSTVVVGDGPTPDGAVILSGPSVDLVEALSLRGPFPQEIEPADRWLFEGLATVFDQPVAR